MIIYWIIVVYVILSIFIIYWINLTIPNVRNLKFNKELFKQNIPKIVHQTWETKESIPPPCLEVIKKNKKLNPTWEFVFWDDKARRKLIEDNFDDYTLSAYDKLSVGAMKADLFRICVLYIHGGLYMDIKGGINKPLDEFLSDKNKLCYMLWPYGNTMFNHPKHAATSFLIWPKGHPLLPYIIREISRRIHQDFLNLLPVIFKTGPEIYTPMIFNNLPNDQILESKNYFDGTFTHDGTGGAYYDYIKSKKLHWSQQGF